MCLLLVLLRVFFSAEVKFLLNFLIRLLYLHGTTRVRKQLLKTEKVYKSHEYSF